MTDEIIIKNQPIFNKILNKINNTQNNVQAYILCCTSKTTLDTYSNLFSKVLICPYKYKENCNNCNICSRIDNNIFSELKIINPVNGVIKKECIIELRNDFQTQSIEGKNEVYIINDAECLNQSSANAILKFLEEPDTNTVAICTTTNLDAMISTIKSRCQIIKLNNNVVDKGIDFVIKQTNLTEEEIYESLDFIRTVENNYSLAFSKVKDEFLNQFKTKEKLSSAIYVILLFYKDVLNHKLKNTCLYFEKNDLINIANRQSVNLITKKISFVLENMYKLEYNVNMLLFMDNLLIRIGEMKDD